MFIYLFIYLFIFLSIFCFQAIKQRRVYVLRYELCDNLPVEKVDLTDGDPNRKMWDTLSPIALFASAENGGKRNNLRPVAIQMHYTPGSVYKRFMKLISS